jgi:copper homeostasis protein (lipoprotein)
MRYPTIALAMLALAGCATKTSEAETAELDGHALHVERITAPNPLGELPAAFSGTLPCGGCPGIDIQLHLLDSGVYFLRETYRDRAGGPLHDIGRFLITSDGVQLSLHGGREAPVRYAITSPDTLRLLNQDGGRIQSELNPDLARQPGLPLLEPRLLMAGTYRYLAGVGRFHECLTGLEMPVAAEADNRALEQAYLAQREGDGQPLLVSLEGRIAQRMPMEGPGPVPTLVPERFIGIWPGQACPPQVSAATLENTYWRLVLLGSSGVERFSDQREPHLVLREQGEVAGADGCNRLIGRYLASGSSIEFSSLAATRMSCPQGMAQADAFRNTLERASRARVIGNHLEVLDEDELLLMRFEAVALQ